jgi:hypothetical protein
MVKWHFSSIFTTKSLSSRSFVSRAPTTHPKSPTFYYFIDKEQYTDGKGKALPLQAWT